MTSLPLFPLKLVLLPYELLPLHIFEPRYKKMVKDHIEENKPFGIILNEGDIVFTKGCTVKIQKIYKKYSNGEYDILVQGVEQFRLLNTRMEGETVIGEIDYMPINHNGNEKLCKTIQDLYLQVLIKIGIDNNLEMHMGKKLSYEFIQGFELPLAIKKQLILMDSEVTRLTLIKDIFENILNSKLDLRNNIPTA